MERHDTRWQLVLRGMHLRMLLLGFLATCSGSLLEAASQRFAVAIPAMEGPLTMGIFSEHGKLVRLLYRDATVETIPSGLNGLIMTWDGKDDLGNDLPAGSYHARGLVHGPICLLAIPSYDPIAFPPVPEEDTDSLFPVDRIVLRAAEDELLDSRHLISLHAVNRGDSVDMEADGLPVVTIPLIEGSAPTKVFCLHGARAGAAIISVERGKFRENYLVSGLEQIVPMDAGKLEVSANAPAGATDASHPAANAGESAP